MVVQELAYNSKVKLRAKVTSALDGGAHLCFTGPLRHRDGVTRNQLLTILKGRIKRG